MIDKKGEKLKDDKKKSFSYKVSSINKHSKKTRNLKQNELNILEINSCQLNEIKNLNLFTCSLYSSKNFIISNQNRSKNAKNNFYIYPYDPNKSLKRFCSTSPKLHNFNSTKNLLPRKNIPTSIKKKLEFSEKLKNMDIKTNLFQYMNNNSVPISQKISSKKLIKKENENFFNFNNNKNIINSHIFKNLLDNFNNNINIIHKYNEYKEKYFVDRDNDNNKNYLTRLFNETNFNKNNINDNNNNVKKNKFQIYDFNINIKLSSLTLYFYEISKISKPKYNSQNYSIKYDSYHFDSDYDTKKIISKIRFPFEFLGFFYGINFEDFLKFILFVIEYDYEKNIFFIKSNLSDKVDYYKRTHDFFNNQSYFETFKGKKTKEYFKYHWDIKLPKTDNKNIIMKIALPQMNIDLKNENSKIKFHSCVDVKRMGYFLRENFKEWDFYILNYFLEYKIFRYYINKNLCDKYTLFSDPTRNKNNNKNENLVFNLNNNLVILNSKNIDNNNTYSFFFSQIVSNDKENYLFNIKIPQIYVTYNQPNNNLNKIFELDIKRMSQLNKLRKSFHLKNLINFGLIYIKENKKDIQNKKTTRKNLTVKLSNKNNSKRKLFLKKPSVKGVNMEKRAKNSIKEDTVFGIKDIKLNLDKYIFNFDEDLLKFIKVEKNNTQEKIETTKQNSDKYNTIFNSSNFDNNIKIINNKNLNNIIDENQKLKIEIGTVELNLTNQNGEEKNIIFDKNESEKLLDLPLLKWRFYIENNFSNYITSQFFDNNEETNETSSKNINFKNHKISRTFSSNIVY